MNFASSERLTDFLDRKVFIWNDLVSAEKSSTECTPNHFWQIFRAFLRNFSIDQPFTSNYRPFSPNRLKCASSERMIDFLDRSFLTWNDVVSSAKSSKECTPDHFWQFFFFFFFFEEFLTSIEKTPFRKNKSDSNVFPTFLRSLVLRQLLYRVYYTRYQLPLCLWWVNQTWI